MGDQLIWERIVGGDVVALRILHDKYYDQLWLWANKFILNRPLSEEVVASGATLKLHNHRPVHGHHPKRRPNATAEIGFRGVTSTPPFQRATDQTQYPDVSEKDGLVSPIF